MREAPLAITAVRLDPLQTTILKSLYARSERRQSVASLAREVFPGADAYPDAELMGFVMPRLRRMCELEFVRLERLGAERAASISLKGIEFVEQFA